MEQGDLIAVWRRYYDQHVAEIERLVAERAQFRYTLTRAAETLEKCRYSEKPMAEECRRVLEWIPAYSADGGKNG